MSTGNKRSESRMPLQIAVTEHVGGKTRRGMSFNLGPDGLYLNRLRTPAPAGPAHTAEAVGLEFQLPDSSEVIWAAGEVCHERRDPYFRGSGIRFTAMAEAHRLLIAEFVQGFHRDRLKGLLATIRRNRCN